VRMGFDGGRSWVIATRPVHRGGVTVTTNVRSYRFQRQRAQMPKDGMGS